MLKRYIEKRVAAEVERRAGYTDLIIAGLRSQVEGSSGSIQQSSALEIAARIWSGALAAATVTGTGALTPSVMAMIGRQIIRAGEALFIIDVVDGAPVLRPASSWDVLPGWSYKAELAQPGGKFVSRTVKRAGVLFAPWAVDPIEPWQGVAPMTAASLAAQLAAAIESKLGDEATTPAAVLIPIPSDGGEESLTQLRADIGSAAGSAVLVESTASGWEEGQQSGTLSDWRPHRLGPMIDIEERQLHEDALQRVLAACGIPGSLAGVGADGTQLREDYRRFVMGAVEPWAKTLAYEASEKLDAEVSFDFGPLWAHDLQGRSTAFAKLAQAGVAVPEALDIAGVGQG